jgi:hypothetical protein
VPLSKFAEKIESIKLLMGGIFVYLIGLTLITFGLEILPLVFLGMVIYSIGEFMVAPGYLAFVSKLAPKEKVSAYIGCNFLASFTGIFGGALIFGLVAGAVGVNLARPHFFYGILMGFGLLILILFIVYYKAWGQEIIGRAKKIEAMEKCRSVEELEDKTAGKEPFLFKIFDKRATQVIAALLIPIVLIGSYAMGTNVFFPPDDDDDDKKWVFDPDDYNVIPGTFDDFSERSDENSESMETVIIDESMVKSITVTLVWSDEPDADALHDNQPDSFTLNVTAPNGTFSDDGPADNGNLEVKLNFAPTSPADPEGTGTYEIEIICGDCGDQTPTGPNPFGRRRTFSDTENDWTLSVEYEYYEIK